MEQAGPIPMAIDGEAGGGLGFYLADTTPSSDVVSALMQAAAAAGKLACGCVPCLPVDAPLSLADPVVRSAAADEPPSVDDLPAGPVFDPEYSCVSFAEATKHFSAIATAQGFTIRSDRSREVDGKKVGKTWRSVAVPCCFHPPTRHIPFSTIHHPCPPLPHSALSHSCSTPWSAFRL
jgi:hypothetical protein